MKISCPECGSSKIKNSSMEIVCNKCGFVLEDTIFSMK